MAALAAWFRPFGGMRPSKSCATVKKLRSALLLFSSFPGCQIVSDSDSETSCGKARFHVRWLRGYAATTGWLTVGLSKIGRAPMVQIHWFSLGNGGWLWPPMMVYGNVDWISPNADPDFCSVATKEQTLLGMICLASRFKDDHCQPQ